MHACRRMAVLLAVAAPSCSSPHHQAAEALTQAAVEASHQPDAALSDGPILTPDDIRALQWAIQFCSVAASSRDFPSFGYYGFPTSYEMKDLLYAFMRREGKWIPNDTHITIDGIIHRRGPWADDRFRADDRGCAAFRAKLSNMIHSMTGAKPRFVKMMNGKVEQWAVYHK